MWFDNLTLTAVKWKIPEHQLIKITHQKQHAFTQQSNECKELMALVSLITAHIESHLNITRDFLFN